jgi:hypothetical protein
MTLLIDQMRQLIALFLPRCGDTETMEELQGLLGDEKDWVKAHYLSTRIRTKAINAVKTGDLKAEIQFSFEEVCAKTLHNLSGSKKPFDADTPYWIIPLALKLAKVLEIDSRRVLEIAAS